MTLKQHFSDPHYRYQRRFSRLCLYDNRHNSEAFQALLSHPDRYIKTSQGPVFKNKPGDTSTVVVVNVDSQQYVVKRYNFRNILHAIKLRLRPSRARRSWINAHLLMGLNIPTVKPVALIEERIGWLFGRAYFISEYCPGVHGYDYFGNGAKPHDKWPLVAERVVGIIHQLAAARISHPDLKYTNFVIYQDQPYLLDLDYMQQYAGNDRRFVAAQQRDLQVFLKYLAYNPPALQLFQDTLNRLPVKFT